MKKYKINDEIVYAESVVDAVKKVKDSWIGQKVETIYGEGVVVNFEERNGQKQWQVKLPSGDFVKTTRIKFNGFQYDSKTKDDYLEGLRKMIRREQPTNMKELKEVYKDWARLENHGVIYYDELRKMAEEFNITDSVKDDYLNYDYLTEEEQKAVEDYKNAIRNTTDPKLLDLFAHILQEETEHIKELKNAKEGNFEDSTCKDMAMSRNEAIDRCYSLGKQFISHFDKIYKNPNSSDYNHHVNEMQNWYNQIKDITLKEDKKPLSKDALIDWFFTATGNPNNFMQNPTREELDIYNDFTYNVLLNNNVKTSLETLLKK